MPNVPVCKGPNRLLHFFVILSLLAGVAQVAQAASHAPINRLKYMLLEGDANGVLSLIANLPADEADQMEILFLKGQAFTYLGHYSKAVSAYQAMLSRQPNLPRVRLEIAWCYFRLQQWSRAEFHLQLALAEKLPPNVRINALRLMQQIKLRKPFDWGLSFGAAPSSNINAATSHSDVTLDLFGQAAKFHLNDNARAKSGVGIIIHANAEVHIPISRRSAGSSQQIKLRGDIVHKQYGDQAFNDTTAIVTLDHRFEAVGHSWSYGAVAGRRWYGGSPYYNLGGATLDYQKLVASSVRFETNISVIDFNYLRDDASDGAIASLSGGLGKSLSPLAMLSVSATASRKFARAASESYVEGSLSLRYIQDLGRNIIITLEPSVSQRRYDSKVPIFGVTRRDMNWSLSAQIVKSDWVILGLSPFIRYDFRGRSSNIGLYDLSSHQVMFGMTKLF